MSTKLRTLVILAAVLLVSAVVLSAVAAQDATATAEPPAASTTEPSTSASESSATADERPFLGVSLQDSDSGVTVVEVLDGSAAADAGIKAGDVFTAVNGAGVATVEDVKTAIAGLNVGDDVTIDVTRGEETMSATATLGAQPARGSEPRAGGNNPLMPGRGNRGMDQLGLSYDGANQTWTITSLSEDNPLYAAGLREGDVITALDGESVDPASLCSSICRRWARTRL
jgi:S1-C subfamily serine protease